MKVDLVRAEPPFHFVATGSSGVPVHIDASPDIGRTDAGARPMEVLVFDALPFHRERHVLRELLAAPLELRRGKGVRAPPVVTHSTP